MAIQPQPSRISEPFAGSGSKNVIPATNATPSASQAASWASGFPPECSQPISAGGCPVPRDDMNGIFNQISQDYAFRQDGGIWAWSAAADYDLHRLVLGSDGNLYWSVAQSGPNMSAGVKDPALDTAQSYWKTVPTLGVLPVSRGGTGSATKNFVDLTTSQIVSGVKTFTSPLLSSTTGNLSTLRKTIDTDMTYILGGSDDTNSALKLYGKSSATNPGDFELYARSDLNIKILHATPSGTLTWDGQPIQTSSDERIKTSLEAVPDDVLDAWEAVGWGQFQYLEAVQEKGEAARLHLGLIAQRVKAVFDERGLDACQYGILCHEERPATETELAVDLWMVRYTEALAMEAACQRRRADRAEARLAALEERLAAIEDKLNTQP